MFNRVVAYLEKLSSGQVGDQPYSDEEKNTAIAALLYRMVSIDGIVRDVEKMQLRSVLKARFAIHPPVLEKTIARAISEHSESAGLFPFTSIIMHQCDLDERQDIIMAMWHLALCDGELHEYERNLIERAAELLETPSERPQL
ncbi:MAG: TerB family tellurite resistance protein [Rhizobiaceae bacterium]|nr:TerB family tellurite resistance protein [Rhizobiaceae bacterium]